jgi:hypothetical protein
MYQRNLKAAEDMSELYRVLPLIEGVGADNIKNDIQRIRNEYANQIEEYPHFSETLLDWVYPEFLMSLHKQNKLY